MKTLEFLIHNEVAGKFELRIMRTFLRFFLFLFLFSLLSCSTPTKKLETAEQLMENAPDSALLLLKQLKPSEISSDANRAFYGLLLFEALDKTDKKLQPDSVIDFSISYYLSQNDNVHLAKSYYFKARKYKFAQCYDDATILYLKSLDYLQKENDFALMGRIYSDLGDINSMQINYKESLKKYFYSLDYYNRAGKKTDAGYANLSIGRIYHFEKNYRKAQRYYNKVIAQTNDSILLGVAFQEIGSNYYWDKQYDSAQYYLRKSLRYPFKGTNYAIRCYILSDLLFDIGQYNSSRIYALDALKHEANYFTQRDCYRILVNIEYFKKDITQMGKYMKYYQSYTDSIRKIESQTKTTVLEKIHNTSLEVSKTKEESNAIIGMAILLIIATSIFYFHHYLENKKNNVKSETLFQQNTGKIKSEELYKRIHVVLNKIEALKAEQTEKHKKASVPEKEQMDRRIYDQLIDFNNEPLFFKEMDLILNNVVTKLTALSAGITAKEMIWCCLYLLQIPNQDVLLLLNYKAESLSKLKQRIARKLNQPNVIELCDFLHDTMLEK